MLFAISRKRGSFFFLFEMICDWQMHHVLVFMKETGVLFYISPCCTFRRPPQPPLLLACPFDADKMAVGRVIPIFRAAVLGMSPSSFSFYARVLTKRRNTGLTSLFLIIVLGLSAHLITISTGPHGYGVVRDVEGLGVAVAVLSFVTVIPLYVPSSLPFFLSTRRVANEEKWNSLVLSLFTRGSFFNWNVVELPVLGFILILWLAESAIATQWTSVLYPGGCSGIRYSTSFPPLLSFSQIC